MILDENQSLILNELISTGSIERFKCMLTDEGTDVNSKIHTEHGCISILSAAILCNQYEICNYLLGNGADPNISVEDAMTPLFWSMQSNVFPIITKLLLDNKANQNHVNANNTSVFSRLLQSFNMSKAQHLFMAGIKPSVNTICNLTGQNVLHEAIQELHEHTQHATGNQLPICVEICQKLIEFGADVNAIDNNGNTPLHVATSCLCYDTMELILCKSREKLNLTDRYGLTPLQKLSQPSFLVSDRNESRPFRNLRAMIEGVYQKVEQSEEEKKKIKSYIEQTILDCVQLLCKHGADVNAVSESGETCLHFAFRGTRFELKKLLVRLGADVNAISIPGRHTPLICANNPTPPLISEFEADTRLLLDAGADMHQTCCRGWSPLFHSIFQRRLDVADLLLTRGSNAYFKDSNGVSALHIACWTGKLELIELLLKHGCKVGGQDIYGATPLFYAVGPNFKLISKLLIKHGALLDHNDSYGNSVTELFKIHELDFGNCEPTDGTNYSFPSRYSHMQMGWNDHPVDTEVMDYEIAKEDDECLELEEVDEWIDKEQWKDFLAEKVMNFLKNPAISIEEESQLILKNVNILLTRIGDKVKCMKPELAFTPIISGSVSEGTKITYPDEFDFLLCLDNFQDNINIVEECCPPSYCLVQRAADIQNTHVPYFEGDGNLIPSQLTKSMYTSICKVISSSEIWEGLGLYWVRGPAYDHDTIDSMQVYWVGSKYKFLSVSIDLVVAITMRDWWPRTANRNPHPVFSQARNESCLLVVKRYVHIEPCYLRISFSKVETEILRNCPSIYKRGYMLAKTVRSWLPSLRAHVEMDDFSDDEGDETAPVSAEFLFSSYILKTCLFYEIAENSFTDSAPEHVARNIWSRVAGAVKTGILPSFFITDYKVYEDKDPGEVMKTNGYPDQHVKAMSHMIATVLQKMVTK